MRQMTVGVILFLLAGCGGDDTPRSQPETTEGSTATTAGSESTSGSSPAADETSTAQKLVLQLADFPAGWRESTEQKAGQNTPSGVLTRCVDEAIRPTVATGRATSKSFTDGKTASSLGTAAIFSSPANAARAADALEAMSFGECIKTGFRTAMEQTANIKASSVGGGKASFPQVGERTVAYRTAIEASSEGQRVEITIDTIFAQKGRAITGMIFDSALFAPDSSLEKDVLTKSASRAE